VFVSYVCVVGLCVEVAGHAIQVRAFGNGVSVEKRDVGA